MEFLSVLVGKRNRAGHLQEDGTGATPKDRQVKLAEAQQLNFVLSAMVWPRLS
jgi:hypothetical protein